MIPRRRPGVPALLIAAAIVSVACLSSDPAVAAQPQTGLAELQRQFQSPPADSRIMMRWWWFGPAVTPAELEREMRLMKEGGIGGFEVQPVYALALDDPAKGIVNLPYLSKEFLADVRFTAETARKLGLRMDMTLGSGWPFGGPHIPIELASRRLRLERFQAENGAASLKLPDLKPGEAFLAAFIGHGSPDHIDAESLFPIEDPMNGEARFKPSAGPRVLLVIVSSRTRQMVKRAAVGAEGLVLDHLSREALDKHLETVGERLYEAAGPGSIRAMFCDSLEVYSADWAKDMLVEFRKRRGYDLKPLLPALFLNIGSRTDAVRHDWGQTLSELLDERFVTPLAEWCHRRGLLLRMQAYGYPPAGLFSYADVDLPEGEGVPWNEFTSARWASSAGHNYGRRVISAETWTWLHSPVFRATPLDMKAEADQHFLQGINQIVGHGWPYSPEQAGKPGWRFYAAGVFNQNNPWWLVMPAVTRYLQRVSFLLRQGEPANGVALYAPTNDAWAHFTLGHASLNLSIEERIGPRLIPALLQAGYNFDLVDDTAITRLARVERGGLRIGDHRFPMVLLPAVERVPPETLEKLREFAQRGGVLVSTRPLPAAAGSHVLSEQDPEFAAKLHAMLRPDMILSPSNPEVGFIRRDLGDVQLYFIANTGNAPVKAEANFRVEGKTPEWWNPQTGEVTAAEVAGRSNGGTTVPLAVEPYGSRLLVFGNRPAPSVTSAGRNQLPPLDLPGGWEVTFENSGKRVTMNRLRSWTDDPATRFYSGRADYRKVFSVPAPFLAKSIRVALSLGEASPVQPQPGARFQAWLEGPVREAAVVFVNGKRAGMVWSPPYEADVTGLLRDGENELRIVVGNLAINQLAGEPLPDYTALNARYGHKFDPQDMENLKPVASGLLGQVRLIAREPRSLIRP